MKLWRKRFISGPDAARHMWRELERLLLDHALSPDAAELVHLAFAEAAANVMEHGYNNRADRPLDLALYANGSLMVSLHDRCPDSSWADLPIPNLKEQARQLKERGRGRAMMAAIASRIDHRKRIHGGNILALTFEPPRLEEQARELAEKHAA